MRSAIIYLSGEVIGKLSLFLLFPIYGHFLSVADFGVISILFPTLQTLQGALGLGLPLGIMKYYYDRPNQRGTVYFNALVIWGVAFLGLAAIFFILIYTTPLAAYQLGTYSLSHFSLYLVVALLGWSLLPFAAQIYRAERRPIAYVGMNAGSRILIFCGIVLYLILGVQPDAVGVFRSIAGVALVMFATAFFVMIGKSVMEIDRVISKELLFLGLPQAITALCAYFYMVGGRLLLNENTGTEAVGIFGMVHGLVLGLSLLIAGFAKVYVPELFLRLSRDELDQDFLFRVSRLLMSALLFAAVVVQCASPWLLQWMGKPEYLEGKGLFPILLMTVLIQGAYIVIVDIFVYFKKTGYLAIVSVSFSVVMLVLVALLTPKYGFWGLAAAHVVAACMQLYLLLRKIPQMISIQLPYKMWFGTWICGALALQAIHLGNSILLSVAVLLLSLIHFIMTFRKDGAVLKDFQ